MQFEVGICVIAWISFIPECCNTTTNTAFFKGHILSANWCAYTDQSVKFFCKSPWVSCVDSVLRKSEPKICISLKHGNAFANLIV